MGRGGGGEYRPSRLRPTAERKNSDRLRSRPCGPFEYAIGILKDTISACAQQTSPIVTTDITQEAFFSFPFLSFPEEEPRPGRIWPGTPIYGRLDRTISHTNITWGELCTISAHQLGRERVAFSPPGRPRPSRYPLPCSITDKPTDFLATPSPL